MKCFFHKADLDGRCSGAIIKFVYPECELIGIDYGEPFPWDSLDSEQETVFMVDFSLQPFEDMVKLASLTQLTWIDHHKSAIEDARVRDFKCHYQVLDSDYAACELCWMRLAMLVCGLDVPLPVHWLGRYDIWKHKETPGSLEFQYGMRLYDTDPNNQKFWQELFLKNTLDERIRSEGEKILSYERQQNAAFLSAYGFETELDGLRCLAANRGMTNSLLFESEWDPERYDAMLCFAFRRGQWTVSLYTDKTDVDVSAICKARGGGGHKGAAGFQCATLPFLRQ